MILSQAECALEAAPFVMDSRRLFDCHQKRIILPLFALFQEAFPLLMQAAGHHSRRVHGRRCQRRAAVGVLARRLRDG